MENQEKNYSVRCSETGTELDGYFTYEEAESVAAKFEAEDKKDGEYESGFYEIYNVVTEEIERFNF